MFGAAYAPRVDADFVRLAEGDSEHEALAVFLTGDTWPFHGVEQPTRETAADWLAESRFFGSESRSFWVRTAGGAETAGLVTLKDLQDRTPLFDLRLRAAYRGRGLGTAAVRWLTRYLFTELPEILRIEGDTRQDNIAMQRTFERCGYVRESHHRQAWPSSQGFVYDAYGYAILRQDWLSGGTTPVHFGPGAPAHH